MTRLKWNLASLERRAALGLACIVILAGGATLSGFLGRLGWLVELTAHFRVQYFLLLSASALALAVCKRTRLAAVGAALATANLAVIVPLYFGPGPSEGPESVMRVMSLNVFWKNHDYRRTLESIRAERPDVVLLLEVTPEWIVALGELDAEYAYSRCIPRRDSGGIAMYSRVPVDRWQVRHAGGLDLPTLIASYELAQGPLTLMGLHPPSPSSPELFEYRNRQLAAVGRMARRQSGAVVMLGDLNITSWSPFFQDLLADSGLFDSRRGFGVLGSWPRVPLPLRIPIDHCLVSSEVSVRDRRVGPSVGSDHRAVIVDFTIRQR